MSCAEARHIPKGDIVSGHLTMLYAYLLSYVR